jgi:biotin synthase-related radical SAM superfamily protein
VRFSLNPDYIRVSIGTAAVLGLVSMQLDAFPTTAYLMLYTTKRCRANCGFCPQARESQARSDALSRIFWPQFSLEDVKKRFESPENVKNLKRICIQVINYENFFEDLQGVINTFQEFKIPISVSVQPLSGNQMKTLYQSGVNRIGIPLDAATKTIFNQVKGKYMKSPYKWETHLESIKMAQSIFGSKNVSTHLIIGLGESELDAINFIENMVDSQVLPALFTFTPVKGASFENRSPPALFHYRKIQLARYLLINNICRFKDFAFNEKGELIKFGIPKDQIFEIIRTGQPFLTSGCPGCNRPFYNERPGSILFNYPKPLTEEEIKQTTDLFEENMQWTHGG